MESHFQETLYCKEKMSFREEQKSTLLREDSALFADNLSRNTKFKNV